MTDRFGALGAAAFAAPRHHFIPGQAWARPTAAAEGYWIDRERDGERWWGAVYSDTVIVTQLDDGMTELTEEAVKKPPRNATCSSSGPSLVFAALDLLDARPGHRVLEIGTGTGWTAGLLSHLVGEERVTSVEIDKTLAGTAKDGLARAGFSPHVVVADGAEPVATDRPFDRVHVTCGVYDTPYTWITQTRPGGVIVMPWSRNHRVVRLIVHDDGTATGTFHDKCGFMPLRSQRPSQQGGIPDDEREREVHPDVVHRLLSTSPGWEMCLMERVGDTPFHTQRGEDGSFVVLTDVPSGTSLARVHLTSAGARVTQRGPRNLWDEAERAYDMWTDWGCPGIERFGMAVTPTTQYMWLDDPDHPVKQ